MKTLSLVDFIKQSTQDEAAKSLGITQGAIWQAVRNKREIYVTCNDGRPVLAYEYKPFGNING